jgi:hypothetical protein
LWENYEVNLWRKNEILRNKISNNVVNMTKGFSILIACFFIVNNLKLFIKSVKDKGYIINQDTQWTRKDVFYIQSRNNIKIVCIMYIIIKNDLILI